MSLPSLKRSSETTTSARSPGGEVREFMSDREIVLVRERDQDRILRCGRRAILGDKELAYAELPTGKRHSPTLSGEPR